MRLFSKRLFSNRLFPAVLVSFGLGLGPASAACIGHDLIADLPQAERQALQAATDAVPFPAGNRWRAEKAGQVVDLIGTYHLDDPRLAPMLAAALPALNKATALLVEAGPEEEKALKERIGREPALLIITDGPTLPETLPPEIWARLSDAMAERGIPGFMAAKFRPWYISMMLSIPTCALTEKGTPNGLDRQLIDAATARGTPVQALEPYDTVFRVFNSLSRQDQVSMITSALAMVDGAEDMSATLTAQYFAGENRLIWEFMRAETLKLPGYTPEQVAQEFATMEEAMINSRNQSWIPVIDRAAEKGPVLVAFGALTRLDGP
jgi:hypothetical protein